MSGEHRARSNTAARNRRVLKPDPRSTALSEAAVTLTHGDRVLFPKNGYTKADLFRYYRRVAPAMVKALSGRPIAMQQWPKGINSTGFFRQDGSTAPEWATKVEIQHERRKLQHLIVDRVETLEWLANQSAMTMHMWSSRIPHLGEPDWVVFDLDPRGLNIKTVPRRLNELGDLFAPALDGNQRLPGATPAQTKSANTTS
jgi:bifunctional non-homologous end joining protein LigD